MPLLQIRGEDAVTEEILPIIVERLTLAIVTELGRKNGLDVFRVSRQDAADAYWPGFDGVRFAFAKERLPGIKIFVLLGSSDHFHEQIEV